MKPIQLQTENELLQQVAQGNEKAFGRLMQQYANLLGSHIFRLTHSREQTEEIVQDVFLKVWQAREALTDVKNFRTYLYVISRNQALNALRALMREKKRLKKLEKTLEHSIATDEAIADDEMRYSLLEKAIAQVPKQQQEAWLLSRRQGLKYKDIAQRMQLSEETVKKYIHYASLSITRYMENYVTFALAMGIIFRIS